MNITRDDFEAYEQVRESGETNMMDTTMVSELSGLDRDVIVSIMRNYDELAEKFMQTA